MEKLKNKYLRVTMEDGSEWDIPVSLIAENRAKYYTKQDPDFNGDYERSLNEDTIPLFEEDNYEIEDWAANNMNWKDVKDHAECVNKPLPDFQEGWINGEKEIIEKENEDA